MKKSLIAGASVMALAGAVMPMAGVFAAGTQTDLARDSITVSVNPSCTFTAGGSETAETGEYTANGTNGTSVSPSTTGGDSIHSFTVFCNNNAGYTVSAATGALVDTNVANDNFAYMATLPTSGTNGAWNATIAGQGLNNQLPDGGASAVIIKRDEASAVGGESFTATYTAYIGTETPAGTYTNNITYTLATQ